MNPRLFAVAGPLKGSVLPLANGRLSIGRDVTNDLPIADRSLSRRHSLLRQEGDGFKILDLGSVNRTYVNNLPIEECPLGSGDEIKVGRSLFVFLLGEDQAPAQSEAVELDEQSVRTGSTVVLRRADAVYLQPEKLVDSPALKTLFRVGEAISSIRGLEALERRLCELIFEAIPADDGAILLGGEGEDFASTFTWKRSHPPRSIVERVMSERVAICGNDILMGGDFPVTESLVSRRINSLLAVPLASFGRTVGAIYLDTGDPQVRFDPDHLQLLAGIAGIAAGALENALKMEQLQAENRRLQAELSLEHNMVGASPRMQAVYKSIAKVAPTDSTVLIGGESGAGKELVARAIHRNSRRTGKPFVAINCAALTENLLESELFGHERGAFTGAITQKKGKLEEAAGGSVFLDEIGELAPSIQAKLLRVLQEREFERVGGTRSIKADIRLIAATNRDLKQEVDRGTFRRDLYFRLNVVSVLMPALRERPEDIPALVNHFIDKHGKKSQRPIVGCSEEALKCMKAYDWPGNVRELENAIERAIVMGSSERILPDDLPESIAQIDGASPVTGARFHDTIREVKKQLVTKAMEQAENNYIEAARLLGLHPNNLHRLMKNLNLK